jgi:hypothetical protein
MLAPASIMRVMSQRTRLGGAIGLEQAVSEEDGLYDANGMGRRERLKKVASSLLTDGGRC